LSRSSPPDRLRRSQPAERLLAPTTGQEDGLADRGGGVLPRRVRDFATSRPQNESLSVLKANPPATPESPNRRTAR
jgi:hypothetical protein